MKPSRTRSRRPRPDLRLAAGLAALLLAGCVTAGRYDEVVAERDRLAGDNEGLEQRVAYLESQQSRLELSNESLGEERVALIEELEDLRSQRGTLAQELTVLRDEHSDLASELDERERLLAEREKQIEALRGSYERLVADLESEVEEGRLQVEQLRSGMRIQLPNDVLFAAGSADLSPQGRKTLARVAERLRGLSDRIEVHGHTDSIPVSGALATRYPSNWELAGARAASVVRVLVDGGVDPAQVVAVSHGSSVPLVPNDTRENRARNRRIEVRLVPLEGSGAADAP